MSEFGSAMATNKDQTTETLNHGEIKSLCLRVSVVQFWIFS